MGKDSYETGKKKRKRNKKCLLLGVGTAGCNILAKSRDSRLGKYDRLYIHTAKKVLKDIKHGGKLLIGEEVFHGLGARSNIEKLKEVVYQEADLIREHLQYYEKIIIVCGLGGGNGSVMTPVIVSLADEMNIETDVVCSMPMFFESSNMHKVAQEVYDQLAIHTRVHCLSNPIEMDLAALRIKGFFEKLDNEIINEICEITQDKDIKEIITSKGSSKEYETSENQQSEARKYSGKIIYIMSGMERDGKTTVAANIGIGFSIMDKKVLLIDGDFRKPSLKKALGMENTDIDASCVGDETREYVHLCDIKNPNLHLIYSLNGQEPDWKQKLSEMLKTRMDFDYVIVDVPGNHEEDIRDMFNSSDRVIIVTKPICTSVRAADRLLGIIEENKAIKAELIVNRIPTSTRVYKKVIGDDYVDYKEIPDLLAVDLIGDVSNSHKVSASQINGLPLINNYSIGREFRKICEKIMIYEDKTEVGVPFSKEVFTSI